MDLGTADSTTGQDELTLLGDITAEVNIDIDSGAGADDIDIQGNMTSDTGEIDIDTGTESDTFTVTGSIQAQTDFTLDTDSGSDIITLGALVGGVGQGGIQTVAGTVKMDFGSTADSSSGQDELTLYGDVTGYVDIDIDSGAGADDLDIQGNMTTTTGEIHINTGSEGDTFTVTGAIQAQTDFTLDTDSGADIVTLGEIVDDVRQGGIETIAGTVTVDLGSTADGSTGDDDLTLYGDVTGYVDIDIDSGAGADDLDIQGSMITATGEININTGSEADTFTVTGAIQAQTDFTLDTDTGSDVVNLGQVVDGVGQGDIQTITGSVTIDLGSTDTALGDDNFTLVVDVTSYVDIDIDSGDGTDTFTIDGNLTATSGLIDIDTGTEADQFTLTGNITSGTSTNITMDDGADQFTLQGAAQAGTSFGLDTGSGEDTVDISGEVETLGSTLSINTGETRDFVTITADLEAATDILIYLGSGNDSLDIISATVIANNSETQIYGEAGDDTIHIDDVVELTGTTSIYGGDNDDLIEITRLASQNRPTDSLLIDGGSDADDVIIQTWGSIDGSDKDYIIDVSDSGAANSGSDTMDIRGTANDDFFLSRQKFVALLHGTEDQIRKVWTEDGDSRLQTVERINYDRDMDGRVTLLGYDGEDNFVSDDNSAIMTFDGGDGDDSFQLGQIFGLDPSVASTENGIAAGDEIAAVQTTRGFLSPGVSFSSVAMGGEGNDLFTIYSNKSSIKLEGEAGNDSFVIRAFLLTTGEDTAEDEIEVNGGDGDDSVKYNINAPVSIDGGAGFDTVVVVGTEADDSFVITEDGVFGAGLNIEIAGTAESIEVDGVEGDDNFFILSTPANAITHVIGGLGSDEFHLTGDVTETIYAADVSGRSGLINHQAEAATGDEYNNAFIDGVNVTIADANVGKVLISQEVDGDTTAGVTRVFESEGGTTDVYSVALAVAPTATVFVTVSAARASTSDREETERPLMAGGTGVSFTSGGSVISRSTGSWLSEGFDEFQSITIADAGDNNGVYEVESVTETEITLVSGQTLATTETDLTTISIEGQEASSIFVRAQAGSGEFTDAIVLTFDASNWDQEQVVEVLAQDDAAKEGERNVVINHSVMSDDSNFDAALVEDLDVEVYDDDQADIIIWESGTDTRILEGDVTEGIQDTWDVRLTRKPTATVTVALTDDSDTSDVTLSTTTLSFDSTNWDTVQTLTVSSAVDGIEENAERVTVSHTASSSDADFDGAEVAEVLVRVDDGDTAGAYVTETGGRTLIVDGGDVAENNQNDEYLIRLRKQPTSDVTVYVYGDGQTTPVDSSRVVMTDLANASVSAQFISVDDDNDLIVRSSGSWIDDGFFSGQTLRVTGSSNNDKTLFISSISEDETTIVLSLGSDITDETVTANFRVEAGAITFTSTNWYEEVTVNLEADPTFVETENSYVTKKFAAEAHTASKIQGSLIIDGGVTAPRTLLSAVMLPTEQDTGPQDVDVADNEAFENDRVNLHNDGSQANDTGAMMLVSDVPNQDLDNVGTDAALINGLGMGTGILSFNEGTDDAPVMVDYYEGIAMRTIEIIEIMLGKGDDNFTLTGNNAYSDNTQDVPITVIHGGGGGDTITVEDGTLDSPPETYIVVYGDTSADGTRYNYFGGAANGGALVFDGLVNPQNHHDTIDASGYSGGSTGGLVLFGGVGDDIIHGSQGADHIAGGSGGDTIYGHVGDDHIYGDAGFNVDLLTRTLTVAVEVDDDPTSEAVDDLTPGDDTIEGNDGVDIIFGDLGRIDQVTDTIRINNTGFVERIVSTDVGVGGNDTILGGRDIDYIIAGGGDDSVDAGAANNIAFGDAGDIQINIVNGVPDDLALVTSVTGDVGGSDSISALYGDDIFIGGHGDDVLEAGQGNNIVLGDSGVITATNVGEDWGSRDDLLIGQIATTYALVDDANPDGADQITTGVGMDIILGGGDADQIIANDGESALTPDDQNIVLGDYGQLDWSQQGTNTLDLVTAGDLDVGGADEILTGLSRDIVIGGADGDTIDAGAGENVIFGDGGRITFNQTDAFAASNDYDASGEEFSVVSINFGTGNTPVSGEAGTNASASDTGMIAPRTDQWIETAGGSGVIGRTTDSYITDDAGNWLEGLKVEWSDADGRALRGLNNMRLGAPSGDNDQGLFETSLSGKRAAISLKLEGLDAHFDEYDIYVYSDGSARTTSQTIVFSGGQTYTLKDSRNVFDGTYTQATSTSGTGDSGNYVVGKGLSGDTQQITISTETRSGVAILSGIQIVGRMKPVDHAETLGETQGGDDYIRAYSNRDIVFGGVGDDTIEVQGDRDASVTDSDFIIGDLGYVTFAPDLPEFDDEGSSTDTDTGTGTVSDMEGTSIISFNFGRDAMDADEQAGSLQSGSSTGMPAPRAANWQLLSTSGGTQASGIETDAGVELENLSVSWSVNEGGGANSKIKLNARHGFEGDRSMWGSSLQSDSFGDTITVRVTGLSNHYESYDAYVYTDLSRNQMFSRARSATTQVEVGSSDTFFIRDDRSVFRRGGYVQSTSTVSNRPASGNYVVATELQEDELVVTIKVISGNAKAAIAGLQIVGLELPVEPEETTDPGDSDTQESAFVFFADAHTNIVTLGSTTSAQDGQTYDDSIFTGNGKDVVIGGLGSDYIDTGARGTFDNVVGAITDRDVVKTSINFSDSDSKTHITASASAGIVEDDAWNNLDLRSDAAYVHRTQAMLETSDGIRVELTGNFGFKQQGASAPDSENERLVNGGLYTANSRSNARVEISNITDVHGDESYDLYFYTSEDASLIKVKDATLAERSAERLDMDIANEDAGIYVIRDLFGDVLWFELETSGRGRSAQHAVLEGLQIVSGVNRAGIVYAGDRETDVVLGDKGRVLLTAGTAYDMQSLNTLEASTADGADEIWTGENGDFVIAGDGADWISGEAGADMILGDNGGLTFIAGHTHGWNDGHEVPTQKSRRAPAFDPWNADGIEFLAATKGGADTIIGGADNDVMYGQGGDDHYVFEGAGLGVDAAIEADDSGQAGLNNDSGDLLDFRHFSGPVSILLETVTQQKLNLHDSDSNLDSHLQLFSGMSIEDVIGSEFGDWIGGNNRDNLILGLDGDDTISSKYGYDMVDGGDGDDDINRPASRMSGVEWGSKVILGGAGEDIIYGSTQGDLIDAGDGDDKIHLTQAPSGRSAPVADLAFGGAGDDIFYLSRSMSSSTVMVGNDGDDKAVGKTQNRRRRSAASSSPHASQMLQGDMESSDRDAALETWLNDHVSATGRTDMSVSNVAGTDLTDRVAGIHSDRPSPLRTITPGPGETTNPFSSFFGSSIYRTDDPILITNSMHLAVGRLTSGEEQLSAIDSNDILISVREDKQPQSSMQRHYAYNPETGEFEAVETVADPADFVQAVSVEIGDNTALEDAPFAFVDEDGGLWLSDPDHLVSD